MLIAFLGVVFLSIAFQFYLVNRSVSRTLQEVHGEMLSGFWEYNNKSTDYNRETVKVIWDAEHGIASAREVPRVGLLQDDLPEDLRIYSHWVENHGDPDGECTPSSPPCKRTKAGGGLNAGDPWDLAGEGLDQLGSSYYYEWIWFNVGNAFGDLTGLKEDLQEAQASAQAIKACTDDPLGCLWDCIGGNCPWDD